LDRDHSERGQKGTFPPWDTALDSPKYRAFLSYSHRDAKWGAWLHKSLESYRPPKQIIGTVTARGPVPKRLSPIFRDREELASATDLGALLNEALRQSACQVVICSPSSARSKWVNEEILAFKRLGREDRIFALIVGGEPYASEDPAHAEEECFPPALRYKLGPDGNLSSERTEPIAADARPGKDGRNNAKLKLIAGLLGVGFDGLRQREQRRRQRQLFMIASGAIAGMVITSGLAAAALIARAQAQRQTVIAKREAETARQTTAFLVDLFKVSDPSEARGNSLTAREVLDKGAVRVQTQLKDQPQIRATLQDTLGTVYMGLGLYSQARPLLDSALAAREGRARAEPGELSETLNHRGELLSWQGDFAAAEKDYREVLRQLASEPEGRRRQEAQAQAHYGLGIVLAQEGRGTDAQASLSEALTERRALYGEANDDTARTLKELAKVLDQNGDLKAAIPLMVQAVAIQRGLRGGAPHPALAEAINDLAVLQIDNDQPEEAEKLMVESLAMYRRLYGEKHANIAMGLNNLALIYWRKSEMERAEATYREAYTMLRELLGENHPDVAFTLGKIAFAQYEEGHTREGMATLLESLHMYQRLFPGDNAEVARTMNLVGYWEMLGGDYAAADRAVQAALAMRRRLFDTKHPDIASSLLQLAMLEVATGKFAGAERDARAAREIYTDAFSPTYFAAALAACVEGAALTGLGDYAQAEKLLNESTPIVNKDPYGLAADRALVRGYLLDLHRQQQRLASRRDAAASR